MEKIESDMILDQWKEKHWIVILKKGDESEDQDKHEEGHSSFEIGGRKHGYNRN